MKQHSLLDLFCGLGGGGLGFARAGWRTVGAFDRDPAACRDYERITGHRAEPLDLATASPADLRRRCSGRPDAVLASPPCQGNSACLPSGRAKEPHYQALNSLSLRGIWLALEAWAASPPPLVLVENVPRITVRSRRWLDQLVGLLEGYGYACRETLHCCGELGGLAQRRRRWLLVARHVAQVPEVLYEPPRRRVRGIGEVLGELPVPLPGSDAGGPMHRLPRMSPLNWVRLALIPAGRDWRALPPSVALAPRAGRQNGPWGVEHWDEAGHAVIGRSGARDHWGSVADPRVDCEPRAGVYGVQGGGPAPTVVAAARMDNGRWSVADPRIDAERREGALGVTAWTGTAHPVIAAARPCNTGLQVADPRLDHDPRPGTLAVRGWAQSSHVVRAEARATNGPHSVADPRVPVVEGPPLDLDPQARPCHLVIRAADGTWHRPLTTLELAVLQGLPAQDRHGDWLVLDGQSHAAWRRRIGNAIPPPTAEAIARSMSRTLEAAARGQGALGLTPVWVEEAMA